LDNSWNHREQHIGGTAHVTNIVQLTTAAASTFASDSRRIFRVSLEGDRSRFGAAAHFNHFSA